MVISETVATQGAKCGRERGQSRWQVYLNHDDWNIELLRSLILINNTSEDVLQTHIKWRSNPSIRFAKTNGQSSVAIHEGFVAEVIETEKVISVKCLDSLGLLKKYWYRLRFSRSRS